MKSALGTVKILTFLILFHMNCRVFCENDKNKTYSEEAQIELGKKTAELRVQALRLMKLRAGNVTKSTTAVEEVPFWGDIQMDEDLLKDLKNSFDEEEKYLREKDPADRTAPPDFNKIPTAKWSMPIKYTTNYVNSNDMKQIIRNGLNDIQAKTGCISFVEVQGNPAGSHIQYVERTDLGIGVAGNSPLGRQKRINTINLASVSGKNYATVVHETLHTLGFGHTQTRPDRNKYLEMHLENVPEIHQDNFKIWQDALRNEGKFDYGSIMIYQTTAFAVNGRESMIPIIDAQSNRRLMNMPKNEMSVEDVNILKKIYCGTTTNNSKNGCTNNYSSCTYWSDQSYCEKSSKYYSFVSEKCRKSCKLC